MTLIAAIKASDGIVLAADSEEVIPEALRTTAQKIRVLYEPAMDWHISSAGAGDVDYIRMVGDLIQQSVSTGNGTDAEIRKAIRQVVHEVWRDHVHFEQSAISIQMLLVTYSHDKATRLTVVNNGAVRDGRELETFGIGDATFRSLADRYLNKGLLSFVGGDMEALRMFMIFAMQRAKQAIPGVGGNTNIVTVLQNGNTKWEKSWKVSAVQDFFSTLDADIRHLLGRTTAEDLVTTVAKKTVRGIKKLRKEIARIEADRGLI